jgi:hypothetical protein
MPTTPLPSSPISPHLLFIMYRLLASPCEPRKGAARVKEYTSPSFPLFSWWLLDSVFFGPCICSVAAPLFSCCSSAAVCGPPRNKKQKTKKSCYLHPHPLPRLPPPPCTWSVCAMLAERDKINAATQASACRQQRVQTVVVAVHRWLNSFMFLEPLFPPSAIFPRVANHQNRFRCIAHTHKKPRRPPSPPRPVP